MRCLKRNQQTIWYALLSTSGNAVDENGDPTGEALNAWGEPIKARMNIRTTVSEFELHAYGLSERNMIEMLTDDMDCPLWEDSLVWYEADPKTDEANYRVIRRFAGLDSIRYFCERVDVNG